MSRRDYGNGSIYFSESRNRWVAQCKTGISSEGKIKRTTVYGKTKREVKDKLERIKAEVNTGIYVEPSKLTVVDLAKLIANNKKAANIITDNTYKRTMETIKKIEAGPLSYIPIQKVTELVLSDFVNSLTSYSNSVIKKVCASINASFKLAIQMDLITKNPMEYVLKPKSQKETKKIRALKISEQKAFIEAVNKDNVEPYRTMLLLSLFTGMRMGEVSALEYNPFIIKSKTINVKRTITRDANDRPIIGKTTKTYAGKRTIKLDDSIVKLLTDYIDNHYVKNEYGLMFISSAGTIISTNQVNSYYKRLIERYQIANVNECNQHQLRHTFATRCIESGMPAKVLQKVLGHREISTTLDTYTDVYEEMENKFTNQTLSYLKDNNIAI